MTRIILLTTAIVTGLVVANSAAAFGGPKDAADRPSFAQLDANGDGTVSATEMEAFGALQATERFKSADSDGDGKISTEEMAASMDADRASRAAQRVDRMVARFDTDKDGMISEDEMTAAVGKNRRETPGARFISWADTDKDGVISEDEYAAVADKMQQRQGRGDRMDKRQGGRSERGNQMPFWRN